MKIFTILGTGWLGAELAEKLKDDYKIKVSLRDEKKSEIYKKFGFSAYLLNEYYFSFLDELFDTDYLFINYPPSKFENYLVFLEKIYNHPKIKNIEKIIFVSSTSVYPDIKVASKVLFQTGWLYALVIDFYKREFWDKMKLDQVNSQEISDELFIFGTNVNWNIAAMKAQKFIGIEADGFIGNETLKALNSIDEQKFDIGFDEIEKKYYDAIIKVKPYLEINRVGWYKRAMAA